MGGARIGMSMDRDIETEVHGDIATLGGGIYIISIIYKFIV